MMSQNRPPLRQSFQRVRSIDRVARNYAGHAVRGAEVDAGVKLDGSERSVEQVDKVLTLYRTGPRFRSRNRGVLHHRAREFGYYVGEVFRRHHGGTWGMVREVLSEGIKDRRGNVHTPVFAAERHLSGKASILDSYRKMVAEASGESARQDGPSRTTAHASRRKRTGRGTPEKAQQSEVEHPKFGRLAFDPKLGWFAATVAVGGKPVRLAFVPDDPREPEECLGRGPADPARLRALAVKAAGFAGAKLLRLRNASWRQPDEPRLTAGQFVKRITLDGITVMQDGTTVLYFLDGDLFWGHCIVVTCGRRGGLQSASVEG